MGLLPVMDVPLSTYLQVLGFDKMSTVLKHNSCDSFINTLSKFMMMFYLAPHHLSLWIDMEGIP